MTVKQFTKSFNGNGVESELVKTIFLSLLTSIVTLGILYFVNLNSISDLIPNYGYFIFFSILSISVIIPAINQVRAYKEFACMSGMMIGMTIGMISGFLPAFFIASTNGMFYGSILGMAIGIYLGVSNGKCCGVMGVMEGLMAGFMGGLMGAMTAVMTLNDHLKYLGVVIFIIGSFIMFTLNYMIYTESKQLERNNRKSIFFTIILSLILTTIISLFIIYGPRGGLFQ